MGVTKVNKSSLSSSAESIKTKVQNLKNDIDTINSVLNSVPSHQDFPALTSKISNIVTTLQNISNDYEKLSSNILNYVDGICQIDEEGFDTSAEALAKLNPTTVALSAPANYESPNINNNSTYSHSQKQIQYSPSTSASYAQALTNYRKIDTSRAIVGKKYNYEGIEEYLSKLKGTIVTLPAGLGVAHTYMGWQCITSPSSNQYKLREVAGMNFDEEGFAKIGDRYVVATTTTYGNVGDFIDVYQSDGTVIKCVIGDIKNQNDSRCNEWGHEYGQCVLEFVVDKDTWYSNDRGSHVNPGTSTCHPEWHQSITKIENKGNYFDLIELDVAKIENSETQVL